MKPFDALSVYPRPLKAGLTPLSENLVKKEKA